MSSSATSALLPQELVDIIIDELKYDVVSLRACSLVSKPWAHRSRKHIFESVYLPTCLLRKWLKHIPASPASPLGPHHHLRSLSLQPTSTFEPFCVPESFADHLSSFTQLSNLVITSIPWGEWADAFTDSLLVTKYFGGFGQALRNLELTRVYLNMVALKGLLDVFTRLERLLIFSPIMLDGEAERLREDFSSFRDRWSLVKAGETSNVVAPHKRAPVRLVNNITLLFPPTDLVVGLAILTLHCRELVLTEDCEFGGDVFNLLLNSTGPSLESLVIQNALDRGSIMTLENCSNLRKLRTKGPYHNALGYISEQARLIRTVTSTVLEKIIFSGKSDGSQLGSRTNDWLEPAKWEIVDRELCNLMDRLDGGVSLQVVFADGALAGGGRFGCVGCETGGAYASLLYGVRMRGGIVKVHVQKVEELAGPYR